METEPNKQVIEILGKVMIAVSALLARVEALEKEMHERVAA